jgi:hypothetical protein
MLRYCIWRPRAYTIAAAIYVYAAKSGADIVDSKTAISVQSPFHLMKGLGHGQNLERGVFSPSRFSYTPQPLSLHTFYLSFSLLTWNS